MENASHLLVFGTLAMLVGTVPTGVGETLPVRHSFTLQRAAEGVATITASCERCDWGVRGREAGALRVEVDGQYSQHVLLTRGSGPADYQVLLGPMTAGSHVLSIRRDTALSAPDAGDVNIGRVHVQSVDPASSDHGWLAEAPMLYARAGTVERFSDVPLAAYVEALPSGRGYRYTIVFSHEDGGTPTDRLMATWGRATDIEAVYESERVTGGVRQEYQGPKHEILPFRGKRIGAHPLLWVSTDNNMVSDSGPSEFVRFAPAPALVDLTNVSREAFMDARPWLYAVMAAELRREGRIEPTAAAGSGKIADPLLFGYLEACGDLRDAMLAFDVGVDRDGEIVWHATDRGDARFRIARSGCFRAAVPLPPGTTPSHVRGLRARAYTRPARQGEKPLPAGAGRAALTRINTIFMLDARFTPVPSGAQWVGSLDVPVDGAAVVIPIR